jgi:hypothetical protein
VIYWTIGALVLLYVSLLVSRLLQAPVSAAQSRDFGLAAPKATAKSQHRSRRRQTTT